MTVVSRFRAAAGAGAVVLALAACSGPAPVDLPDLTGLGLTAVPCEDTGQMASVVASPSPGTSTACWQGAPDAGFVATADAARDLVLEASAGQDVTGALCWDDTLTATEGSACRAVLVGSADDGTVVSVVIAVTDPGAMTEGLGDSPTDEQVATAIGGSPIEVLVFAEPAEVAAGA